MDDCLKLVDFDENVIYVSSELSLFLKRGGFRLIKWLLNKYKVVEFVFKLDRVAFVRDLDFDYIFVERVFGV